MSEQWRSVTLLVVTAVVAATACVVARRALHHAEIDSGSWTATLSYIATAYGVVVGFSILFLFGEFADARQAVGDEATSIGTAYDQAELFPHNRDTIQGALVCYARAVPRYDWPAMRNHEGAPEVDTAFDDLVLALDPNDRQPVGALHSATATNLAAQIGNISTARETRLVAANTRIPGILWVLLLGGGALVVVMIFVVTYPARVPTQVFLVSMAAVFTAVMLLLVNALSDPFGEGSGRVSPELIEQTVAAMDNGATTADAKCAT